jgi:outer membrane protein OmpA-like peptidoglycan-associated protein
MSKPLAEELAEFQTTLDLYRKRFAEDGTITADEQTYLDVLEGKIKQLGSVAGRSGAENGNVLGGLDTGQVKAGPWETGEKVAKGIWNWITEEGVTTIIIENLTSKVLRFNTKKLLHEKESTFVDHPPTEILAAKGPHDPTTATITVQTNKWVRGVTRADTSGFVVYDIVGTDKQRTFDGKARWVKAWVRAAWSRKGKGQFDDKGTVTDLAGHKFEVQQVKGGTITYRFSEDAPNPKPAAPSATPPADTFVLFDLDKSELTSKARSQLHAFAVAYKDAQSTAKIKVEGWASIDGKEARNEKLSYNRAEAVFKYLVDTEGLSKDNVTWEGKKTTSDFDSDKKKLEPNRRVTIKLK